MRISFFIVALEMELRASHGKAGALPLSYTSSPGVMEFPFQKMRKFWKWMVVMVT
jgi:hypothetical protein